MRFLRLILGAAEEEDEAGAGLGFEDAVALCDGPGAGPLATAGEVEEVWDWGGDDLLGSEACPWALMELK
jgi:hypothetical protein